MSAAKNSGREALTAPSRPRSSGLTSHAPPGWFGTEAPVTINLALVGPVPRKSLARFHNKAVRYRSGEPPQEWLARGERMEARVVELEPWVLPVIDFHGRYVVDLKRGHFRQLENPYEAIPFSSQRGRALCGATGIVTCQDCHTSFMIGVPSVSLRCMRCGSLIRGAPEARDRNQLSLTAAMMQEDRLMHEKLEV